MVKETLSFGNQISGLQIFCRLGGDDKEISSGLARNSCGRKTLENSLLCHVILEPNFAGLRCFFMAKVHFKS